jgi:hypothetical protein
MQQSERGCEIEADNGTNILHLSHLGSRPSSSMMMVSKRWRWAKCTLIESRVLALPLQLGTGHGTQPDGIDTL